MLQQLLCANMEKYFKKNPFTAGDPLPDFAAAEFESCRFIHCALINQNFSKTEFNDCSFEDCDLSGASLQKTSFSNVRFTSCKLQGLQFNDCNEYIFECVFDHCQMNYASFYNRNLKQIRFDHCRLDEVDFTGADLSGNHFPFCSLSGAVFEQCNLEKTDFRTALNFSIDPGMNRMKKARFSRLNLEGLLDRFNLDIE